MRQAAGDFQADLSSRKEGSRVLRINRFQGLANFDSKTIFMLRRGGGYDLLQNLYLHGEQMLIIILYFVFLYLWIFVFVDLYFSLHGEQMLIIFFVFVFLVICVVCVFVSLCISVHLQ